MEMPYLRSLAPEEVMKYKFQSRMWRRIGPNTPIPRNFCRDIMGVICVEYLFSEEESRFGKDCRNVDSFPEEEWIKFLLRKFVFRENVHCPKPPCTRFAELLERKVIVDLLNPQIFRERYDILLMEYEDLNKELITPEWERSMVLTFLDQISIGKSKTMTKKWKMSLNDPRNGCNLADMKFIDVLNRIKEVNEQYTSWYGQMKYATPSNSINMNSSENNSGKGMKRSKLEEAPSAEPAKRVKIQTCCQCTCHHNASHNASGGECRSENVLWANQGTYWKISETGMKWSQKELEISPSYLEGGNVSDRVRHGSAERVEVCRWWFLKTD